MTIYVGDFSLLKASTLCSHLEPQSTMWPASKRSRAARFIAPLYSHDVNVTALEQSFCLPSLNRGCTIFCFELLQIFYDRHPTRIQPFWTLLIGSAHNLKRHSDKTRPSNRSFSFLQNIAALNAPPPGTPSISEAHKFCEAIRRHL